MKKIYSIGLLMFASGMLVQGMDRGQQPDFARLAAQLAAITVSEAQGAVGAVPVAAQANAVPVPIAPRANGAERVRETALSVAFSGIRKSSERKKYFKCTACEKKFRTFEQFRAHADWRHYTLEDASSSDDELVGALN